MGVTIGDESTRVRLLPPWRHYRRVLPSLLDCDRSKWEQQWWLLAWTGLFAENSPKRLVRQDYKYSNSPDTDTMNKLKVFSDTIVSILYNSD